MTLSQSKKRKSQRTLLFLGGALAVVVTLLVLSLRSGPTRDPNALRRVSDYVGMRSADVTRVEIKKGDATVVLARRGDQWNLEQPVQARAAKTTVEEMLKELLDNPVEGEIASKPSDLTQYGLKDPGTQITLASGGSKATLQVGGNAPGDNAVYVRTGRGDLFALGKARVDAVREKKTEDLREKKLAEVDPETVRWVTVTRDGETTRLEKREAGTLKKLVSDARPEWTLTQPFTAPADQDDITNLLDQLKSLEATTFIDKPEADAAKYGLAQPQATVAWQDAQGEHTLLLGKQDGKEERVFAQVKGEAKVVTLAKFAAEQLSKGRAELRSRKMLDFKAEDAERLLVESPGGKTELRKKGKDWFGVSPFNTKADADKISSLLGAVTGTAASHVEEKPSDVAKYGLQPPAIKVTVWAKGKQAPLTYDLGSKHGKDQYYARANTTPAVFLVQEFIHADLNLKPDDLKAK